jgi:pimeloyl-ACP methyl ester carboxylesterase
MQIPGFAETLFKYFPEAVLGKLYEMGKLPKNQRPSFSLVENSFISPLNQYRAFVRELSGKWPKTRKRLDCPLLVLWGEEDPFLLTPTIEEWEKVAVEVTSRILPAGHWIHLERPREVNSYLERFFNRVLDEGMSHDRKLA